SLSLADDGGGPDLHPLQQLAYGKPVVGSSPTPLSGFRSTGRRAPCLVPLSGSSSGSPGAQAGGGHLASFPSQAQNQGSTPSSHCTKSKDMNDLPPACGLAYDMTYNGVEALVSLLKHQL
uniref:Uncharacterized protein n=1 Tax=Aegilops tauschii subsp. strangulata TaxID=200361 RepID=A0A453G3R0_AEGTS